jgi:intracellular multiplication protein IcmQ
MALSNDEIKAAAEILKALDEAIQQGPWTYNLFFRGIGKKLEDAREHFKHDLSLDKEALEAQASNIASEISREFVEVYISLYQAQGAELAKWLAVINSLIAHNISRPIYKNEADVQAVLRTKLNRQNDAYVVAQVRLANLMPLPKDKPPVDRMGHPLLLLRENAIQLENIIRFVHVSGVYYLRNGALVKQ